MLVFSKASDSANAMRAVAHGCSIPLAISILAYVSLILPSFGCSLLASRMAFRESAIRPYVRDIIA
jgi:hypothetical protein